MRRMLQALAALGCAAAMGCATTPAAPTPAPTALSDPSQEVFYHIFTRSFRDSNGDGEGDLNGVTEGLDYLRELGVTSILLTPLYPSHYYHNYFATEFYGVDPEFGTIEDYQRLVAEAHRRGMKVYLDQEMQYVTDDHVWWAEPRADRSSRYTDYILWDDRAAGIAEEGPFGLREAPGYGGRPTGITTINLHNPEVRAYFERYFLYWVDPNGDGDFNDGVDGFRIDHMMDDLDNKGLLTNLFAEFWTPLFARLRATNPNLHIIAEQADWGYGGDFLTRGDADMVFAFPLRGAILSFNKDQIVEAIAQTEAATPAGRHQLLFIENHDTPRIASADGMTPERLRTAAGLSIFLRGTPLLYYGQELGMRGKQWAQQPDDTRDIGQREAFEWEALTEAPTHANWYRSEAVYWTQRYSRDNDGISVAEESRDPNSLLSYYRRALALRRAHPALQSGSQRVLEGLPGVLVVERSGDSERFLLVANLSGAPLAYQAPSADLIRGAAAGAMTLRPDQLALFRVE